MDDDETADLIRRLFAVMTGTLEDMAAVAAEGQGRRAGEEQVQLASRLCSAAGQIATIAEATAALADRFTSLPASG